MFHFILVLLFQHFGNCTCIENSVRNLQVQWEAIVEPGGSGNLLLRDLPSSKPEWWSIITPLHLVIDLPLPIF